MRRSLSAALPVVLALVSSAFLFAQQPAAQGGRQGRGGGAAAGGGGERPGRANVGGPPFQGEGGEAPGENRHVAVDPGEGGAAYNAKDPYTGDAQQLLIPPERRRAER